MIKEELTNLVVEMRRCAEADLRVWPSSLWARRALAWADRIENLQKLNDEEIQALQPYVQHLPDCDYMQVHYGNGGTTILAWPHEKPCTCGLASLTRPGASINSKIS